MQYTLARGALLAIGLALSTATVLAQDAPAGTTPADAAKKPAAQPASSDSARKPAPAAASAGAAKKPAVQPASSDSAKKPAPAAASADAAKKPAAQPAASSDAGKKAAAATASIEAAKKKQAQQQPGGAAAPGPVEVDPKLAAQASAQPPVESTDMPPLPPHGYTYKPDGRRDPFVTLVKRGADTTAVTAAARAAGLAGLASSEVTLRGILASEGRYVAMLFGADEKTYIAHAGDKLSDGTIQAITADAMVIQQRAATDQGSVQKPREIRKRLRRTDATN